MIFFWATTKETETIILPGDVSTIAPEVMATGELLIITLGREMHLFRKVTLIGEMLIVDFQHVVPNGAMLIFDSQHVPTGEMLILDFQHIVPTGEMLIVVLKYCSHWGNVNNVSSVSSGGTMYVHQLSLALSKTHFCSLWLKQNFEVNY